IDAAPADVGTGKRRAVEERLHAVVRDHGRAPDLVDEPGTQRPLDRPARVIGTQAEEEGRARAVALEHFDQAWDALAGATVGVDVDLEGELQGGGGITGPKCI